ncbi:hypothetical protein [Desulfitobacterium hafniense]|nr:hypothetical protein [Desulfitobacterium hafniense]
MNEEEFWTSTPRKIGALWEIHAKFNGFDIGEEKSAKEERVFIDQVLF